MDPVYLYKINYNDDLELSDDKGLVIANNFKEASNKVIELYEEDNVIELNLLIITPEGLNDNILTEEDLNMAGIKIE